MHQFGGERDCTKFQIYYATPPSVNDDITIICYHCSDPIIKEVDQRYIIVAGAFQRPLYLHDNDCYEEFTYGMTVFYKAFIVPAL